MLQSMVLEKDGADLIKMMADWYDQKVKLYKEMDNVCSKLIGGPEPDVDYAKVAAAMPKINASIQYIDQSLFKMVPWVFAQLIDRKPDAQNHLSHLVITREQRSTLIERLNSAFGKKLDQDNQNYVVSGASVLRDYLLKDYKCSDDPW